MKLKKSYLILILTLVLYTTNACSSDEGCEKETWYEDADDDGFGNPANAQQSCVQPVDFVLDNTDFDDVNATAFPGADEVCDDGIDNNGDDLIDECGLTSLIKGEWIDDFGAVYTITDKMIVNVTENGFIYVFHILKKGGNFIICRNDSNNPFYADLYSKFVFTEGNRFCMSFFDSPSQADIESSADPSDSGDLDAGCGGFLWGILKPN